MGISNGKLSKKELKKISAETKFSKIEVKQWYRGFMRDCPSGKLNRTDFIGIYSEFFPTGNVTAFATFMFNLFDEDLSGEIDFTGMLHHQLRAWATSPASFYLSESSTMLRG